MIPIMYKGGHLAPKLLSADPLHPAPAVQKQVPRGGKGTEGSGQAHEGSCSGECLALGSPALLPNPCHTLRPCPLHFPGPSSLR